MGAGMLLGVCLFHYCKATEVSGPSPCHHAAGDAVQGSVSQGALKGLALSHSQQVPLVSTHPQTKRLPLTRLPCTCGHTGLILRNEGNSRRSGLPMASVQLNRYTGHGTEGSWNRPHSLMMGKPARAMFLLSSTAASCRGGRKGACHRVFATREGTSSSTRCSGDGSCATSEPRACPSLGSTGQHQFQILQCNRDECYTHGCSRAPGEGITSASTFPLTAILPRSTGSGRH